MNLFLHFFSHDYVFFHVFGYSMSYLEFIGTIFNLWSVWLVTRNNVWTWPIGNIGVILFCLLFYQIQLYSDFIEQIYFLVTGFYGWWAWLYYGRDRRTCPHSEMSITKCSPRANVIYFLVIVIGSLAMGFVMQHIHEYCPRLFGQPASLPYLDAFTTVMSFSATILMAHKKIECWYLWITVDIFGIGIYLAKEVIFVSILYGVFLVLASKGLFNWSNMMKQTVRAA